MHPILFTFPNTWPLLGGKGIHLYGILIALGFFFGLLWIKKESKRLNLPEQKILDLFFYLILTGIIGSRLLYEINSVNNYWQDPLQIFRIWEGGLVFQGGLIASLLFAIWYCRKNQISFFQIGDVFAPALALGQAFGRVGCLFAGCCYGKSCDLHFPLAITFPNIPEGIAPPGVPLYPTQILESLGIFLLFLLLSRFSRKKPFDGAVLLLYIILYAILRSSIEIFRGDSIRGFIIEPYLSVAQLISLITLIGATVLWQYLKIKQSK